MALPIAPSEFRHRKIEFKDLAILIALVIQIAALVWGAAMLKASVDQASVAITELRTQLKDMDHKLIEHDIELRVLKDREERKKL